MTRKKMIWIGLGLVFLMVAIPIVTVMWNKKSEQEKDMYVNVYLTKEDRVIRLPLETYIEGVVAAEMPADFHLEALKAQALAARTYIAKRLMQKEHPDMQEWGEKAKTAVVTDTVKHQAYITDQALQKKWAKDYIWKKKRIQQSVHDTAGHVIMYDNQPIYAAYFSTSNGWTENSEDYFQAYYPYLRSVSSSWDQRSPKYKRNQIFTLSQFETHLKEKTGKQVDISNASEANWMRVIARTQGKRIAKIVIGDQTFTGRQVREALGLYSSDFSWKIADDQIDFQSLGYGHGVGMSQWGAHLMAVDGKAYEQIIHHYYQKVEIKRWNGKPSP